MWLHTGSSTKQLFVFFVFCLLSCVAEEAIVKCKEKEKKCPLGSISQPNEKALFTNQPEERIHLEFCEFKIACLELCEHRSLHLAVGCGVGWYLSRARSSASVWPFKICQPDPENPFFCRPFASALRGFYSRLFVSSSIQRWRLLAPLSIELLSHSGSTTPGHSA